MSFSIWNVKATSSAVSGSPSLHSTPSRIVMTIVDESGCSHSDASHGLSVPSRGLTRMSGS
ncbi:hypothetical protein N8K70_06455 [Microbacterium betulae]|uniref:Uncharacterized protein n=1 Tax=Microbacterium betulae TaxID=2981139 RepID=A0AA97FNT6_9MICO|nr:hypothetical protein [Microbacterium sp. AB]WOF24787.1 hypothetical protein N8K70_06455 [Microbacterium sp. AB]